MNKSALAICQQNSTTATAKKEQMRAEYPMCAEIVDWILKAGFKGITLVRMSENGREWVKS